MTSIRMHPSTAGLLVGCLLMAPLAATAGQPCGGPTPCGCGDVVVRSHRLTASDPVTQAPCGDHGLVVDGSATTVPIVLELGGQAILGRGRGVGLQVVPGAGNEVTVLGPGTVEGFDGGIAGSGVARITDVVSQGHDADGFSLGGTGYVVERATARGNGRHGFVLRGTSYRVEGSVAEDNHRDGFVIDGTGAMLGSDASNVAARNGGQGFAVRGSGHDLGVPATAENRGRGHRKRPPRRPRDGDAAAACAGDVSCR